VIRDFSIQTASTLICGMRCTQDVLTKAADPLFTDGEVLLKLCPSRECSAVLLLLLLTPFVLSTAALYD
jgi:hypothetical protein